LRVVPSSFYREFLMSSFEKSGWWRAATCAVAAVSLVGAQLSSAQTGDEAKFEALLKQGFQLHQESKFEEAIPVLESARKIVPQDYFANLLLGIDLLRVGKVAEAVPRLELAVRVKPGEAIADGYLGEAEADLGNFARAAAAYQEAVRRGQNSEKKFDEDAVEAWAGFALERFRALNEELRSSEAGMQKARELEAHATKPAAELKCVGSIEAMERGLALKGAQSQDARARNSRVDAIYQLAICYAVEAEKVAGELKSGGEDAAALHRMRGDVLLRLSDDPVGAETEFKEAIRLRPGDPALLERLAEAQFSAGEEDAAKESAQAALKIDPQRRGALRTLASLEMNARDYEAAVPVLRELVKEEPANRMLKVQLGKALAQLGQDNEAYGLLAPALAAGYPDEKGALHALLSRVLRKMGRTAEADKAEAEAKRLSDKFQSEGGHESK
jgi:predicted Zn-dependent protease